MVIVVEYGDHIGTLKNLFGDMQQAVLFAKKIIDLSGQKYECIGRFLWYCQEKQEYIKIDDEKKFSH